MDKAAEIPHVAVKVAEDELARFLPVEEHLIAGKIDHSGHGPDQDGNVLIRPDMVPDDDVRPLPDEIFAAAEVDLFGKKKELGQVVDQPPDGLKFLFECTHGRGAILPKPSPNFKTPRTSGLGACEGRTSVLI
jgi:hypothetical protein